MEEFSSSTDTHADRSAYQAPAVGLPVSSQPEAAVSHKETHPIRASEYGEELSELLEQGRKTTTLQLAESLQERDRLVDGLAKAFREIDLLLTRRLSSSV